MSRNLLPLLILLGAASMPLPATAFELKSVKIDLPDSDKMFEGPVSDAVNNNCLACHSAGMVLNQPAMSKAAWAAEVNKMVTAYKAPVAPEDVGAIVDYLSSLRGANYRQKRLDGLRGPRGRGANTAHTRSRTSAPATNKSGSSQLSANCQLRGHRKPRDSRNPPSLGSRTRYPGNSGWRCARIPEPRRTIQRASPPIAAGPGELRVRTDPHRSRRRSAEARHAELPAGILLASARMVRRKPTSCLAAH